MQHIKNNEIWIIINNKVYDLTQYLHYIYLVYNIKFII